MLGTIIILLEFAGLFVSVLLVAQFLLSLSNYCDSVSDSTPKATLEEIKLWHEVNRQLNNHNVTLCSDGAYVCDEFVSLSSYSEYMKYVLWYNKYTKNLGNEKAQRKREKIDNRMEIDFYKLAEKTGYEIKKSPTDKLVDKYADMNVSTDDGEHIKLDDYPNLVHNDEEVYSSKELTC